MAHTQTQFTLERSQVPYAALQYEVSADLLLRPNDEINLAQRAPLLDTDAVIAQTGVHLGDLMAVVQLPSKQAAAIGGSHTEGAMSEDWSDRFEDSLLRTGLELDGRVGATKIYCFRATPQGKHGSSRSDYYLMGARQLQELRDGTYGNSDGSRAISSDVLQLKDGVMMPIGRDGWLPNVGWDYQHLKREDPWLRTAFRSVSHRQASAGISEEGSLVLAGSPESYGGNGEEMKVSVGRLLQPDHHVQMLGQAGLTEIV